MTTDRLREAARAACDAWLLRQHSSQMIRIMAELNAALAEDEALRARLAEPEPEPVAWADWWRDHGQHNLHATSQMTFARAKELMKLAFEVGRETALRARLAEPETCKPGLQVEGAEAVAWMLALPDGTLTRLSVTAFDDEAEEMLARSIAGCTMVPLYTAPPARRPLTDEEIDELPWCPSFENPMTLAEGLRHFARAIERAHKITGGNDE